MRGLLHRNLSTIIFHSPVRQGIPAAGPPLVVAGIAYVAPLMRGRRINTKPHGEYNFRLQRQ